jgi:hypothetical protein
MKPEKRQRSPLKAWPNLEPSSNQGPGFQQRSEVHSSPVAGFSSGLHNIFIPGGVRQDMFVCGGILK